MCTGNSKKDQSFDFKEAKALPESFVFTTPVSMAILFRITMPARRESTMIFFVFLSNVLDKKFDLPFYSKFV